MNCLFDYIGLRNCSVIEPLSGLWINDFPGMQNELLEKISTPEQASYIGFWNSTQRVAYQKLKTDIQNALFQSAEVQLDQVLFQTRKEFVQQWQQVQSLPAASVWIWVQPIQSCNHFRELNQLIQVRQNGYY